MRLLDHLEGGAFTPLWAWRRRFPAAFFLAEGHSLAIFAGINGHHRSGRDPNPLGYSAKTGIELDSIVAQYQSLHGRGIDVEYDTPFMNMLLGNLDFR